MVGPLTDTLKNLIIWVLIIFGTFCFLTITGKFFYENSLYFLAVYLYSFLMTVLSLCCTCCTDPGIIPRRPILELSKKNVPVFYLKERLKVNKKELKGEGTKIYLKNVEEMDEEE